MNNFPDDHWIVGKTKHGYESINFNNQPSFPVAMHTDRLGLDFLTVLAHFHQELEMLYIIDGEAMIYPNQTQLRAKAGDIVFLGPYTLHYIENVTKVCVYHTILVNLDFIPNVFEYEYPSFYFVTNDVEIGNDLKTIVEEINEKKPGFENMIRGKLYTALTSLKRQMPDLKSYSSSAKYFLKVRNAIDYIHDNFSKKITINDLCDITHMSSTYFSNCFYKATGKTVVDYINHVRCKHAYNLICSKKYTISEIAWLSGFNNLSYFTRKYREIIGETPSHTKHSFV